MKYFVFPALIGSLFILGAWAEPFSVPEVDKVAGGFRFTEGPAPMPDGSVVFTDIPNNRIHRWVPSGDIEIFREPTGGANGLMVDAIGRLLMCEGGSRRLTRLEANGEITVLAERYQDKKLNSPNDLWIDPGGGIYFSDPRYGKRDQLDQDGEHVYYLPSGGGPIRRVTEDLVRPNGLIGIPDGKTLYIADHGGKATYRYTIRKDGNLAEKTLLAPTGSDGMTLDVEGRIYLTTDKVEVYLPDGTKAGEIEVPERPSNVCFGGPGGRDLFITARTSLYRVRMEIPGAYAKP